MPPVDEEYERYGAFKEAYAAPRKSRLRRVAHVLGMRNRYLRFLRAADRSLPVLEIGCGNGEFLAAMIRDGFVSVVGVEPSTSYQPVVDPALILPLYADAYLDSCPRRSIGTVVALDVFEHIPCVQLQALLALIHDRLVPGGLLIFRVPNMASPLALTNYFGDLTHAIALNEVSIRQLLFGVGFAHHAVLAEPFAYPRSIGAVIGVLLWPFFRLLYGTLLAAFGIHGRVMSPNLICVVQSSVSTPVMER